MEILLRRFFRPGDVYVGCDVARALGCIVKNPKGAPHAPTQPSHCGSSCALVPGGGFTPRPALPGAPYPPAGPAAAVPPLSLVQAGIHCVCHSDAWDKKFSTSAFWVPHEQARPGKGQRDGKRVSPLCVVGLLKRWW